ncbi:MAG: SDR family NAD(P)-dependent oxidoreductase [Phycisphaerales bacterium]
MNDVANGAMLVIGAGGGVGAALCRRLSSRGVRLVVTGRDAVKLSALAREIDAVVLPGDAADHEHVDACVKACVERFGSLSGAVNCAGSLLLKPAHLTSPADFQSTLTANLVTAFNVVRAAAPAMSSAGGGAIVLCSSAVARHGFANHEAIAAAKAGVIGLMLSAAATYAPKNIRINCVAPGLTRTPLTERLFANEASLKASQAMHALGRTSEPDDIAAAIDFLLSDAARNITGQVLNVDAGLGTIKPR